MKKIFALFIMLFFAGTNTCFAFSELYYFKDIKTSEIEPLVTNSLHEYGYNIIKQNPYYATSASGDDSAIVILQQSGNNMFYYYQSGKNTRINKHILKEVKNRNVVCEQSFNTSIINVYENLANELIANSGAQKVYTFEDEPEEVVLTSPNKSQSQTQTPQTLNGYVAQISAGTKFNAYLQNAINTASATKGDQIIAIVSDNITYNGVSVIPQGSMVFGSLSKARHATYGSRNGRVVIVFDKIVTPDNQVYNISAEEIDFTVSNEGKVSSAAKDVVTHAAVGALVGVLFALLTDNSVGKAAAVGAGVGGGSSLVYSTAEKGVDAEIPSFTELEITLTKSFNVSIAK